jgi:hypothetical protein
VVRVQLLCEFDFININAPIFGVVKPYVGSGLMVTPDAGIIVTGLSAPCWIKIQDPLPALKLLKVITMGVTSDVIEFCTDK